MVSATFEQALERSGTWGRFQRMFACLHQLCAFMYCANYTMFSFGLLEPKWSCDRSVKPKSSAVIFTQKCNDIEDCNGTIVWQKAQFGSFVAEWELYCFGKDYIPHFLTTIQMIGSLVGSQIGGYLADHLGRKRIVLAAYTIGVLVSLLNVLVHSWHMFAVCRFVIGFSLSAAMVSQFTWAMELTTSEHNLFMNWSGTWTLSHMVVALLAYATKEWRTYLLVVNLISLIAIPILCWFKESPRWLIQQNRLEDACLSLNQIMKGNRKHLKEESFASTDLANIEVDAKDQHYTILHLFATRTLVVYSCVIFLLHFTAGLVSNIFALNLKNIGGSAYFNIFIFGFLRFWVPVTILSMNKRFDWFGRRVHFLTIVMLIIITCSVVLISELLETADELKFLITPFAILSAVVNGGLWMVGGQFVMELYPTVVRNIATGYSGIGAETGGLLVPQLLYLTRVFVTAPYIAVLVSSVLLLLIGYCTLPETKNKPLPDTLHPAKGQLLVDNNRVTLEDLADGPEDEIVLLTQDNLEESLID